MNPTTTTDSAKVGAKLEKPKMWTELNDSEKIERMREIMKQNEWRLDRIYQLENKIQKLRSLFTQHSHSEIGVVSKVLEYDNLDSGNGGLLSAVGNNSNPEEVYF